MDKPHYHTGHLGSAIGSAPEYSGFRIQIYREESE